MKYIPVVFAIWLLLGSVSSFGQCSDVLYDANYLAQQGKLDLAISQLEECIHALDNREDQFEGYRLLAILYSERMNDHKRDMNIEKMLQIKPDYHLQPSNDPSEFRKALGKYSVEPHIQVGFKFGINSNSPRITENHSVFVYDQHIVRKTGFQAGATATATLSENWLAGGDFLLKGVSFSKETKSHNWEQTATERFRMMQMSGALSRIVWKKGAFGFGTGLQVGMDILTGSDVNVISRFLINPTEEVYSAKTRKEKNSLQFFGGITGSCWYQLPKGRLAFDIQYHLYARNLTDSDKRYNQSDFVYASEYVSDDLKLRVVQFNLSYSLPLTYKVGKSE